MNINFIVNKLWFLPAMIIAFTVHEYAHAKVADMLGDKLPRYQGRVTLNPIKHIDPIGLLVMLFAGIGWAKPVETNPRAYKNYYSDEIKVSAAGCIANIITAILFAIVYRILISINIFNMMPVSIATIIIKIIIYTVQINVILAIFNIMPIPGLDGFNIFKNVFRDTFSRLPEYMYRYQLVIFMIFIFSPLSDILIRNPASIIINLLLR